MNSTPVDAQPPSRRWAALLTIVLVAASSVACDTVAEISFDIRKFDKVRSPGPQNVGACMESDTEAQLRFVLLDQSGTPIRPGATLATGVLDSSSFSSSDVRISEGKLYSTGGHGLIRCDHEQVIDEENPVHLDCITAGMGWCAAWDEATDRLPDFDPASDLGFCRSTCTDDDDCPSGNCVTDGPTPYCALGQRPELCEGGDDCPTGFMCEPLDGNSAEQLCTQSTNVEVRNGSLAFLSPVDDTQLRALTLLMDNSGSLHGKGVIEDDSTVRINRATDQNDARIAASKLFLLNLNSSSFKSSTVVSLWSFRGEFESGVKPLTGVTTEAPPNPFVANFTAATNALETLAQESDFGRSNVFIALQVVGQNYIDRQITPRRRGTIVLFTDGPDDSVTIPVDATDEQRQTAREQWGRNFEEALDTLKAAQVEVFIIHLDSNIGADGLLDLRPDPENAVPFPRDADGRFGPIEEYSRIACETGGHYLYVTDPRTLNERFDLLTDLLGGTWKVDITVDTLQRPTVDPGAYRIGAVLEVNADGTSDNYFMAPLGDEAAFGTIEKDDSRGVLFKRDN